jgi:hypothetical protein
MKSAGSLVRTRTKKITAIAATMTSIKTIDFMGVQHLINIESAITKTPKL